MADPPSKSVVVTPILHSHCTAVPVFQQARYTQPTGVYLELTETIKTNIRVLRKTFVCIEIKVIILKELRVYSEC